MPSPLCVADLDKNGLIDILSIMSLQQDKYCATKKKIGFSKTSTIPSSLQQRVEYHDQIIQDETSRLGICAWMCEVVDYYMYGRETMTIAISFFDRFMSIITESCINIEDQFIALVALYLAVKLNEPRESFIMKKFAYLSGRRYSEDDIKKGEYKLLHALSWYVHPPTPQAFARYFLRFFPNHISAEQRGKILDLSYHVIEIAAFNYDFANEKASNIACASICMAVDGVCSTFINEQERNLLVTQLKSLKLINPENVSSVRNRFKVVLNSSSLNVVADSLI